MANTVHRDQEAMMRQLAALADGMDGPQEAETEVLLFGKWSVKPSTKNYIMIALGVIAATAVGLGVMAFISGWGTPVGISLILVGVVVALVLAAVHFLSTDEGVVNDHGKKRKGVQHLKCKDLPKYQHAAARGWASSYSRDDQETHMEKCDEIEIKKDPWGKRGYTHCPLAGEDAPEKIDYLPNTYTFPGIGARKKVGEGKYVLKTADPKLVVTVPSNHRRRLPAAIQSTLRANDVADDKIQMRLIIYDGTKLPKGTSGMSSRSLSYHGVVNTELDIDDPQPDPVDLQVGIFEPRGIQTISDKESAWAKRAGIDKLKPQTVRVRKVNPPAGKKGKKRAPYFTVPDYNCQFTGSNESISSFYSVAIAENQSEENVAAVTYSIIVNSTADGTSGGVIKHALSGKEETKLTSFMEELKEARDNELFDAHTLANMGMFLSIDTRPDEGSSVDAVSPRDESEVEESSDEDD